VDKTFSSLIYLWEQRTLFIGSLEAPLDISTGASTLMLALDKPIRFMTCDMSTPIECKSLLLPAGTSAIIDTQNGIIANCTLDPYGADLDTLAKLMQVKNGSAYYELEDQQEYIEKFWAICASPVTSHEVLSSLIQILKLNDTEERPQILPTYICDPRIERTIQLIQKTTRENILLSDLAAHANLSPSRLTQLFKQQTGLPLRRYRLWHRIYLTTLKIGQGLSLTDAAADAGFTDSSHFIRTFRSMLGMAPSSIFSQAQQLQIILPSSTHTQSTRLLKQDFQAERVL